MSSMLSSFSDPLPPSEAESLLAQSSSQQMFKVLGGKRKRKSVEVRVRREGGKEETISIPASAFEMLANILSEMGKGNGVAILPMHSELTTQQAADLLGVSRPFLVEQLEAGAIPFRKVGAHRRVLVQDLLAFKRSMHEKRLKALEELAEQAQELNMGY